MILEPALTCPEGIVYDDAEHTYTAGGIILPSVSTILNVVDPDNYAGIAEDVLMRAAERGKNSHDMVAMDCRDELDITSLDSMLADRWLAWDRFRHDYDFQVEYSERVVYSKLWRYCGTIDLIGRIKHRKRPGRWQVDLKFTAALPSLVGVQTAGYNVAASESLPDYDPKTPRGCLWISGDKYRFIELTDPSDTAIFQAGRSLYYWRKRKYE